MLGVRHLTRSPILEQKLNRLMRDGKRRGKPHAADMSSDSVSRPVPSALWYMRAIERLSARVKNAPSIDRSPRRLRSKQQDRHSRSPFLADQSPRRGRRVRHEKFRSPVRPNLSAPVGNKCVRKRNATRRKTEFDAMAYASVDISRLSLLCERLLPLTA